MLWQQPIPPHQSNSDSKFSTVLISEWEDSVLLSIWAYSGHNSYISVKEEAWNNFTDDGCLILFLYPSLWKDNQVLTHKWFAQK